MVGNPLYDVLTVETYDEEFDITYPAWTVCLDKQLQISSDTVIKDKVLRTMTQNAEEVIIPFAGTQELNSQMHTTLRKNLKDKNISFLKDDTEMEGKFLDLDTKWMFRSPAEKEYMLSPFLNTRFLINESISLEAKISDNRNIKLSEAKRTDTKDRYMTLAMGNLLLTKIYSKIVSGEGEEYDDDDWSFLAGDYSGYGSRI